METRLGSGGDRHFLVLTIVLCIGLFTISRDVSAGQGPLDGKTFVVETGEKGKSGGDKDTLTFKDGNFHSSGCDQYGFGEGAYTSTVNGDSIQFEAVTTSPTKGKMTWKGTLTGDKIEVGYVWVDASHWYKSNPKPLEKWAKGELKKPE
jgi:hypothetical protein